MNKAICLKYFATIYFRELEVFQEFFFRHFRLQNNFKAFSENFFTATFLGLCWSLTK